MLINAKDDYYLNLIKDDPVRPHIPPAIRISKGREVYVLQDDFNGEIQAVICLAYCNEVPRDEIELELLTDENGSIAVFYTVWSYTKGAGRDILFAVVDKLKQSSRINRYVTLSPKTEMARRFHLANGAVVLQENPESVNYEYVNP